MPRFDDLPLDIIREIIGHQVLVSAESVTCIEIMTLNFSRQKQTFAIFGEPRKTLVVSSTLRCSLL